MSFKSIWKKKFAGGALGFSLGFGLFLHVLTEICSQKGLSQLTVSMGLEYLGGYLGGGILIGLLMGIVEMTIFSIVGYFTTKKIIEPSPTPKKSSFLKKLTGGAIGSGAGIIAGTAAISSAGSVSGLSAAGVTSGLAALGLGAGMTAGLAVAAAPAAILGIAGYAIAKKISD